MSGDNKAYELEDPQDAAEEMEEPGSLAFSGRSGLGGTETLLENRSFGSRIVEALSAEHAVGVLVPRRVLVFFPERQPGLCFRRRGGRHRRQPPDQ